MRRRNILIATATLLLLFLTTAIFVLRSARFSNFVREKIVAVVEESTGGVVEIGSFEFDWTHLTVRIRDFVLHGREPRDAPPIARIPFLELRLKLLSGFKKAIDLRYLGVHQPQVHLLVFPDGSTNIPQPKTHKPSSGKSSLETTVDLAVKRFELENALIEYADRKTAWSARGNDVRLLLTYDIQNPRYQGQLSVNPLFLTLPRRPATPVQVNLPLTIEKDGVTVSGGKLSSAQSQVLVDTSLRNLQNPVITGDVKASVSLPEWLTDFPRDAPKLLTANVSGNFDLKDRAAQIRSVNVNLGKTTFSASGTLSQNAATTFHGNLVLDELARAARIRSPQMSGELLLDGKAQLDARNNYFADGTLRSRGLALRSGATQISDLVISSPFHADPSLINFNGLRASGLGGELGAKISIEDLRRLSANGNLKNFSLPLLISVLTGKRLDYDGTINGSIAAKSDLASKGLTGYRAETRLHIAPGSRGVPLSGELAANYNGSTGAITLRESYLAMPHTRIDLSGSLAKDIDVNLVSHQLNDFLPIANFGAERPMNSLPVVLQGGAATLQARVTRALSAPEVSGRLDVNKFAVEGRSFDRLGLDLSASGTHAVIQNGSLTRTGLQADFDASLGLRKWEPFPESPLLANLTMRNADLADLFALAGENSIHAKGQVTGDVHINGTYGNPLGSATVNVANGLVYEQPFGRMFASMNLADQLITLSSLELDTAGGAIRANGTFQHPRDTLSAGRLDAHLTANNLQLANVKPLEQQNEGVAGLVEMKADIAADMREAKAILSNLTADFSGRSLQVHGQDAGNLTATARTINGAVNYEVKSDFAGSTIGVNGRTVLASSYPTTARASIQNLAVEKALLIAGQGSVPVRGNLSGTANLSGTPSAPNGDLSFVLAQANLYDEPVDRLQGAIRYSNALLELSSLKVQAPAGSITLRGSYAHAGNTFDQGTAKLHVDGTAVNIAKIEHARQIMPGLAGALHLAADVSADLRGNANKRDILLKSLAAEIRTSDLHLDSRRLGDANFVAKTTGTNLSLQLDSSVAQSQIRGEGQIELTGQYATRASLKFANVRYANLAPFVSSEPAIRPAFDALVEGQASINGPLLNADNLNGRLQIDRLDVRTNSQASTTGGPPARNAAFQNDGPLIITLAHSVAQIERFEIKGSRASIQASGAMNFKNANTPLALRLKSDADLGVLQDASRDFYSSGAVTVDATVRGTFGNPQVNGKIELKNANLNYASAPNGLSNANGVILLNGTNASIQNLTAESGGGKITLTGFAGFGARSLNYNVRATANKVRTRYSGVSLTSNANLTWVGSTRRSLLSGTVSIQRIGYSSSSDAGSLLSDLSTPPTTPTAPSPWLSGTRLNIKVVTDPDLHVVSTYAQRLDISSSLTVRGTLATPGVLGLVQVTNGQLVFFGNTYTVNRGTVNFSNPNAIEPVLNVSLETIAQGVDVLLGVSGPMENLKLSYHSDPPLTFQQIVQLLATNTTPADPTIAAHQPVPPQQSLSQMGESALLGQAIANPLASRVQRVFGLSQFKIDPSVSGSGQPTARVTLQQQIANNVTFTYITDVTQTNSVIARVQWDMTPKFSAVALRDYNGNVSLQFLYKFKVR